MTAKTVPSETDSFLRGENHQLYQFLGAHPVPTGGAVFRVWAPNAKAVALVGDFNGWQPLACPMHRLEGGIWEVTLPQFEPMGLYKFAVTGQAGGTVLKADPCGFHMQTRPETASRFYDIDAPYPWQDGDWLRARAHLDVRNMPLNLYELNAGSWRRYPDGNPFSYEKLADELIPYVKRMGYTHIELMPLTEYPLDGSWGYQCIGYFAPTSRFGTPHDLMRFVDRCHQAGIGVLMDWVPAHFPRDGAGLFEFDGGPCYEYADPLKQQSPDWGTNYFDCGRPEVRSFLLSSADYWVSRYHLDGLRVDAVTSMLYLDYGRNEWRRNQNGGRENLEAISLLQQLNAHLLTQYPGVITVAEESTAFAGVTGCVRSGGLGFTYKWNMGWMNDTLSYFQTDPYFRSHCHGKLTFSFFYAFSEHFILPLSHDEVVHGKRSLLDKMPGEYAQKFANTRLFLAYMMAHPGKKLLFMGSEYGQFREWDCHSGLEWFMLDFPAHAALHRFVADLNAFYLRSPALWQRDGSWEGFCWISADDNRNNVIAFRRIAADGSEQIAVLNCAGVTHTHYRIGVPYEGQYTEVFSTDDVKYSGNGEGNGTVTAEELPLHGLDYSVELTLPALSALFFEVPAQPKKPITQPLS